MCWSYVWLAFAYIIFTKVVVASDAQGSCQQQVNTAHSIIAKIDLDYYTNDQNVISLQFFPMYFL